MNGKTPPQAIDIELVVLGALMIDKSAFEEVGDILKAEMFYVAKHQIIYEAICKLYSESGNVDLLTVSQQLRSDGKLDKAGGDLFLIEITQKVSSSAHVEYHSRIIIQKYIQRQLIKSSSETVEYAYREDKDVFDLLDTAYNNLNTISEETIKTQDSVLSDIVKGQVEKGKKIYSGDIKAGLTTPITNLTSKTGGWRDSELIIIAARPAMGKTAFILKCLLHTVEQQIPAAIFSLEMSKEKLTDRLLSMEAKVDGDKFNIHGLSRNDMELIEPAAARLEKLPLYIDDDASLTIHQFQVKAKRLASKFGVKLIVVDYLQLMSGTGKGKNREQEISEISRGLKITAKELNIPIIALSQLSRAVETRGGSKRPLLSDLRESGAIEQDADMVGFLFRPEYYGQSEWDDYDMASTAGECEYIIAKNRNGGLVRNRMKFEGRFTLFSDLEESYESMINKEVPVGSVNDAFFDPEDDKDVEMF